MPLVMHESPLCIEYAHMIYTCIISTMSVWQKKTSLNEEVAAYSTYPNIVSYNIIFSLQTYYLHR